MLVANRRDSLLLEPERLQMALLKEHRAVLESRIAQNRNSAGEQQQRCQ